MKGTQRLQPIEAAERFVFEKFPGCQGALLAGSVVRGEATEASDLDIIVFDQSINSSYRESFVEFGWPIELFVHNLTSYKNFFESDYKRARPSMPRMISEGIVIKDTGIIESIKKEASALLAKGPEKWSIETIEYKRYFLTDSLDDFIGSRNRAEDLFIANRLAELLSEFILRINNQWIGSSKWIVRSLRQYNEEVAKQFVEAFEAFYRNNDKKNIIKLVNETMEPYGGRMFDGFSNGKK